MIDFRIISGLFITLLLPTILYHDREKYSITDSFYMIGGLFFIGAAFTLLISMREYSFKLLIYLLLITIFTDTFAYIIGRLIGRKNPNATNKQLITKVMEHYHSICHGPVPWQPQGCKDEQKC